MKKILAWVFLLCIVGLGSPVRAADRVPESPHCRSESALASPFTDISVHWAREDIDWAYGKGVVSGVSETLFAPESTVTRGMFITMLYRMQGAPPFLGNDDHTFEDVFPQDYFRDAVYWAFGQGIAKGVSVVRFGVNEPVTREQMAVLLYRCELKSAPAPSTLDSLSAYLDGDKVSPYAEAAMKWAVAEGVFTGDSGGRLRPRGHATRGEAAAVLHRFWSLTR